MAATKPRFPKEDIVKRGNAIFEKHVMPHRKGCLQTSLQNWNFHEKWADNLGTPTDFGDSLAGEPADQVLVIRWLSRKQRFSCGAGDENTPWITKTRTLRRGNRARQPTLTFQNPWL